MAIDKLSIVNMALLTLGEESLSAINEATKAGRLANTVYDQVVEECFDMGENWQFATTRAQLSQLGSTPDFGWDYQYGLPDNCKRVIGMVDSNGYDDLDYDYDIELAVIDNTPTPALLTNQSTCYIKYIYNLENPVHWPAWFRKLVYMRIAWVLSNPVKAKEQDKARVWQYLQQAIKEARDGNGMDKGRTGDNYRSKDRGYDSVNKAAYGTGRVQSQRIIERT